MGGKSSEGHLSMGDLLLCVHFIWSRLQLLFSKTYPFQTEGQTSVALNTFYLIVLSDPFILMLFGWVEDIPLIDLVKCILTQFGVHHFTHTRNFVYKEYLRYME